MSVLKDVLWYDGARQWSVGWQALLLALNMSALLVMVLTLPVGFPSALWMLSVGAAAGILLLLNLNVTISLVRSRQLAHSRRLGSGALDPEAAIDSLLRSYDPLDIRAYERLQAAVKRSGRLTSRALRRWARAERRMIDFHEVPERSWSFALSR